jgi:exopolysaccharide biosynthesis polyprenyl glycosylphosphotransferase
LRFKGTKWKWPEVSSPYLNPERTKPPAVDWARLIPGETPAFRAGKKKPAQSVKVYPSDKMPAKSAAAAASVPENGLTLFMPDPARERMAWMWMGSSAADFALVTLNWLFIGALLIPLRGLFPRALLFGYAAGAPTLLLGTGFVHAALIGLMGSSEGLHSQSGDLWGQARILGKSVLWATTVLCFAGGLQGASWATSGLFFGAGLLHFSALLTWRWQKKKKDGHLLWGGDLRNVLIVGAGGVGRRVAAYVNGHPEAGRTVCGFLDNDRPLGDGVVGRVSDLARLARTGFVDEVILAAPHDRGLTQEVLRESRRLRLDLEIVPELFGCTPTEKEIERVGDSLVICVHAERLPEVGLLLKRVVDVVGAGLALAVLSPLLAGIAGLVKLDSPGPVLYCAQRAGRKGRRFHCCKFRTMVSDADALKQHLRVNNQRAGPFFKIKDDPRVTRLGRFLRRYSLDELPQLWNVLKGDMSLVGPRPHPLDDVASYEIEHLARLDVTPGITGLWQVTARRDPSFQRGMELDREYIRSWSLGSDLRILLKTFLAVVQGSGD